MTGRLRRGGTGPEGDRADPIIVADDDVSIRSVLVEFLTEEGFPVFAASNGAEAVELARAQRPCVILMDVMMPVLDGAAATAQLKADPATRDIQIIAMSAGATLLNNIERLEADSLIAKPFDLDALLAEVLLHQIRARAAHRRAHEQDEETQQA